MARRHLDKLLNLLETVAFEGYAVETKEFFLLAYGHSQKRFTIAVRQHIREKWEEIREEFSTALNADFSTIDLVFAEIPYGRILIMRNDISWNEE